MEDRDMIHTRRRFLAAGVTFIAATRIRAQGVAANKPYADLQAADAWNRKWMNAPGAAAGELHLGRFADPMYFLRKEIAWSPNPGEVAPSVTVPVGFVTDFASIPRIFWTLLPPDGLYTYPAILHDYLYWVQPVTRGQADSVLRFAMKEFKVPQPAADSIYAGVRAGGGVAWDDNAKLKQSGEKRVLKAYPTNPTIQWGEWKKKPDVFY
jgi:hypothetical protein